MRTPLTIGALTIALVTLSRMAHAGDGDLEALLNETVVTTASKSAEAGSTAPGTSTIITAEDIRRYGIHSLDEAINFLALGVFTSNTMRAVDIGARGVIVPNDHGNHFLLLVNGHAMNEPLYGAARFERGVGIPLELVDHVEVILGPGSVLYGSNAMLGVINVVTKNARDFSGVHLIAESELGKSARAAAGAGYEIPMFGSNADLTVAVDYYRQRGPDFTLGPQNIGIDSTTREPYRFSRTGPGTGVWGGVASHSFYADAPAGHLRFKLKNWEVNLHASLYKRAAPFNHGFVAPDSDFDDPLNYEVDRNAWADIKYSMTVSRNLQVVARAYGDTFDYQRYVDETGRTECLFAVTTCRHSTLGASRWVGAELQGSLDWLADGRLVTLLGVDARVRSVGSLTDVRNYDTDAYVTSSRGVLDATDRIFGTYLQQTWLATPWLSFNAGSRFDFDERFGTQLSPRAAASVGLWRGGTLKAVYSEAYRAPSWAESNISQGAQIPVNGLRPETVRSFESSVEQRLGSHRLMFGVFVSRWTDLVELHVLSLDELAQAKSEGQVAFGALNATQVQNVTGHDNVGWNATYEGSFADHKLLYALNATASLTDDERKASQHPIAVAPRVFGNARIAYALPGDWPEIAMAASYFSRRPADRAFDGVFLQTPYAPAAVELRGTLSGKVPFLRSLSYRASANYAFASSGAYVIGPTQGINENTSISTAELIPVDRFRVTTGVQYDW